MDRKTPLPDDDARARIRTDLGSSILVEAAAGTGKTTCMVERMVNLVGAGACPDPRGMAAITFTRKAAAEIRARFQFELEKRLGASTGEEKARLGRALEEIDQIFVGTIHSFCARLLRERPVEAGVDPAFRELDPEEDALLRESAWSRVEDDLAGTGVLEGLRKVGLSLSDLSSAFGIMAQNRDVTEWPSPDVLPPPLEEALEAIDRWAATIRTRLEALMKAGVLPDPPEKDNFEERCRSVLRVHRMLDRDDLADVMETLAVFAQKPAVIQGEWRGDKSGSRDLAARAEIDRWEEFAARMEERFLSTWRAHRYAAVMPVLRAGLSLYDRERETAGALNYQDLLIRAAAMLRESPDARHYFQLRFTHLLVDEFQDTDPVQAEVVLLLTASDPDETRWWMCAPREGSLFVVGDPKQSIYRFRRADITTYNRVKEIIGKKGAGRIVYLTSNFRSVPPVINWVNRVFDREGVFSREPDDPYSPRYVRLESGREECAGDLVGVRRLPVGEARGEGPDGTTDEPLAIASIIRGMLDRGATVPRTARDRETGLGDQAAESDFLVIAWKKKKLAEIALRLSQAGIPCEVAGGNAFSTSFPVRLLLTCFSAVLDPDNPVALAAALRSGLFGFSDPMLYRFARNGGRFSYNSSVPGDLPPEEREKFENAFGRLRNYARAVSCLPPLAALRLVASDMGLVALAASGEMGNLEAGGMEKLMEVVRTAERGAWSVAEIADFLLEAVTGKGEYEGLPAMPHRGGAVRVMNLHKAKGLQAPVVFLADPSGYSGGPDLHIRRSDGEVSGYLVIRRSFGSGGGIVLAHPRGWEALEEEEKKFAGAENDRLRYVATTRAGSMMCVSYKSVKDMKRSRTFPTPHLADCEEIREAGPAPPPEAGTFSMDAETVARELSEIPVRLAALREKTFDRVFPSQLGEKSGGSFPAGEHGTEWGTVIHGLLEIAMKEPQRDLLPLAESLLIDNDLPASGAPDAVEAVRSVMTSDLWRRVKKSLRFLTEVPFKTAAVEKGGVSIIVTGAMDLAFEEPEGWVIVDYKTGQRRDYRPQLEVYREVWEAMGCGRVKETGIFWVDRNSYEELS